MNFVLKKVKKKTCIEMRKCRLQALNFNPLPDEKILDWSKSKQIADDILKCI